MILKGVCVCLKTGMSFEDGESDVIMGGEEEDDFEEPEEEEEEEVNDEEEGSEKASVSSEDGEFSSDEREDSDFDESETILDHAEEDVSSHTKTKPLREKPARSVPASERITKPFLTKYEKTRLIATRAQQIANGSMPLIKFDNQSSLEAVELATEELRQKKTPLIVRRPLPNGSYEDWSIEELEDQE